MIFCFRPLTGIYIFKPLSLVSFRVSVRSFRPLTGIYIFKPFIQMPMKWRSKKVSVPLRGSTYSNHWSEKSNALLVPRFRPLTGIYIFKLIATKTQGFSSCRFRPLTGIYIFKPGERGCYEDLYLFPSPYGDLHIQTLNLITTEKQSFRFPSPYGDLHIQTRGRRE